MSTYKAPTSDQVAEAMRRIGKTQLRRAFFEGIENPLWVGPLAEAGAFSHPPEPVTTDDGYIRETYWPEGTYLSKVATSVPNEVVDVLLALRKSNNSWVRRIAFEIGAKIPADEAARLKPLIESWAPSGFGWRTDPNDLVGVVVNLLEDGQADVGRWLANLIFMPSGVKGRREFDVVLEDYWYEQGLPRVVPSLGESGLKVVLPWLVAYERFNGHLKDSSDLSYFSRDSIGRRGSSHDDVEQLLIDAVRDLAKEAMRVDAPSATALLIKSKMLLGRKIAMYAMSRAVLDAFDSGTDVAPLIATASDLLYDEESSDDACRIDYAELARAVATIAPEVLEPLTAFIESGPRVDGERLREWLSTDGLESDVVDQRVQDHIERWKHRWLSAIGIDALPAQLRTVLADLDSRLGVVERPLEPSNGVTMWTGPNSPMSQDDMAGMSPEELVAHLESWRASSGGWGPEPSHEGQGRELSALLGTHPGALAGIGNLAGRLRPTYARAILRGWQAALKADLELNWVEVRDLLTAVLNHGIESPYPAEGGRGDDDVDYQWAKQAAVSLLEDIARKRDSNRIPDDALAEFADLLITSAFDEQAWEHYIGYDGESGMDALTTSLNWQWPIRVRGLIHLMAHGKEKPWYASARAALEVELARPDHRGASRAVLGESLGQLLTVDPDWLTPRVPELFGSEAGLSVEQQIALTTALAVHHYHRTLFELLTPSLIGAIQSTEPIIPGWRSQSDPLQRIGEWTVNAMIFGHRTMDDPVCIAFFAVAPPEVRGGAIGHTAWSFMHAETVERQIRDQFASLWDERVAHVRSHRKDAKELSGFFWFVRSRKFDAQWWLPRLKEALELDPSLISSRLMIGKELAGSADVDPRIALDVLILLMEDPEDSTDLGMHDLSRNAVPMVIGRAIASEDESLKQDAISLMNQLGERGHLALESEVNRVLIGAITQADIDD
jgi:hypothetical protein